VVPGEVQQPGALKHLHALVGVGVITYQVPQIEDQVHPFPVKLGQNLLQGMNVAVHIGDQGNPHRERTTFGGRGGSLLGTGSLP
jgi:hypothetical protein